MSSSGIRELTKELTSALVSTEPRPKSYIDGILHEYVAKHHVPDEEHSQRLQDELVSIYTTKVVDNPARLSHFLGFLHILKPTITGSGRLLQWWQMLSGDVLGNLASQKGLAHAARDVLLDLLVVDGDSPESDNLEDEKHTAHAIQDSLIKMWMVQSKKALNEIDGQARFIENQLLKILLAFGRKKPEEFMSAVDHFFFNKETRILALTLLCAYIQQQPPHLHQMLQTSLFENLLKCLQFDTSTRVISLAITALVMFLPHIPSSLGPYLPALFNIYSRLLFWDRERKLFEPEPVAHDEDDEDDEDEDGDEKQATESSNGWVKMSYLLESDDETVPELLHYFTFLYGLYPINFMSYIRKPQKYLRSVNFAGADRFEIEPSEIRSRSEPFRQVHLLHPNFFHLTMESELSDTNRWINSEVSDIVADCMGLFSAGDDHESQQTRARGPSQKLNLDIPSSLLGDPQSSKHNSRQPVSQDEALQRTLSHTSQARSPTGDSPTLPAMGSDSPTIPPQMLNSNNHLSSLLGSQKSIRSVANGSVMSLPLSNDSIDFLSPLDRDSISQKVSRPLSPDVKIAYLHREIQLLRNDLNLERFLKAQHLAHIAQLRSKQLREARVEAETQNLINYNRQLKTKFENAKQNEVRVRTETEKSKLHSRKWEANITERLRALRDDQKNIIHERDELKRDLVAARKDLANMRKVVVQSESQEFTSRLSGLAYEAAASEMEDLKEENNRLTRTLRKFELEEEFAVKAVETEASATKQVEILEELLAAKESELALATSTFNVKMKSMRLHMDRLVDPKTRDRYMGGLITQEMFDKALESSRNRESELSKKHDRLAKRYNALYEQNAQLREEIEVLLRPSGRQEPSPRQLLQADPMVRSLSARSPRASDRISTRISDRISEGDSWESDSIMTSSNVITRNLRVDTRDRDDQRVSNYGQPTSAGPSSARYDGIPQAFTSTGYPQSSTADPNSNYPRGSPGYFSPVDYDIQSSSPDGRSPLGGGASHLIGVEPFMGTARPNPRPNSDGSLSHSSGKGVVLSPKVVPTRTYGRGGAQDMGKTYKDTKDDVKGKGKSDESKDGKEKKKGGVLRGLRGLV